MGGNQCIPGGTVKAEAAKLPGAGISPKPCPRKCTAEKDHAPHSVRIGMRSRLAAPTSEKNKAREASFLTKSLGGSFSLILASTDGWGTCVLICRSLTFALADT